MRSMPDYRIFIFNRRNHITRIERVDSSNDADALDLTAELVNYRRGAEVWSLT
jgi:hypothetical protein